MFKNHSGKKKMEKGRETSTCLSTHKFWTKKLFKKLIGDNSQEFLYISMMSLRLFASFYTNL